MRRQGHIWPPRESERLSQLFGPLPTMGDITNGPAWASAWLSRYISTETANLSSDLALAVNVNADAILTYDRASAYVRRYLLTQDPSLLPACRQTSDRFMTQYGNPIQLYNVYLYGTAALYLLTGYPNDFLSKLSSHLLGGQGGFFNAFFWDDFCATRSGLSYSGSTTYSDGRSAARLIEQACFAHMFNVPFTPSYAPVQAFGSWKAVADHLVGVALANQNTSYGGSPGGWVFLYTENGNQPFLKNFMNVLICRALLFYDRVFNPPFATKQAIADAIQQCADKMFTLSWITGSAATLNQETWEYCSEDTALSADDVRFIPGSDSADLNTEMAYPYAYLHAIGRTRAGSTPGVDDYADIVRRAFEAANQRAFVSGNPAGIAGKVRNEYFYLAPEAVYFVGRKIENIPSLIVPASPVTWDSASDVGGSLSSGDLVFTSSAYFHGVRTSSAPSGKSYARIQISGFPARCNVGVCTASQDLASTTLGTDTIAFRGSTTSVFKGGVYQADGVAFTSGDHADIAMDTAAGKVWIGRNGAWFSGDPASGTGGFNLTSAQNYFLFASGDQENGGNTLTLDKAGGALPSGFTRLS